MKHIAMKAALVAPILAAGLSGCVAPDQVTSTKSSNPASAWSETSTTSSEPVAAPPNPADLSSA